MTHGLFITRKVGSSRQFPFKTSYGSNPDGGIDLTTYDEMSERQIQIKLLEIFHFHTITSAIHQNNA